MLTFEAPWESRAFGMAVTLHESGAFEWSEFSRRLAGHLAEIGGGTGSEAVLPVSPHTDSGYYAAWIAALEEVLGELGVVSGEEIAAVEASLGDGH